MSRVELKARDEMTDEEFHEMLMRSYRQAMRGEGMPLDEAFEKMKKD
ncbi:MAG: hypothetical protein IJ449_05900 [Clostridia bacterium]|nr:hypothetical protein [Clostridia bacterium]